MEEATQEDVKDAIQKLEQEEEESDEVIIADK